MKVITCFFTKSANILPWLIILMFCNPWHAAAKISPDDSISARFNQPGVIQLEGYRNEHTIKIPIPERRTAEKATLVLSYVNSTALMQKRSRLTIAVNKSPIYQIDLVPEAPEKKITVNIPVHLLKKGYTDLTISVAQNFTDKGCIPADAFEVWTTLRLYESAINIDFELNEVPLSLAAVSEFLFDPKMNDDNNLHLILENYSPENIELATLAASGAALRFDYRPLYITLGHRLKNHTDNIIIGDHGFVNGLFNTYSEPNVNDNIGIRHLPVRKETRFTHDKTHALIYLTGKDPKSVKTAAQAFSLLSYPLPGSQSARVESVSLPEISRYSGGNVLAPDKEYEFSELGWQTLTLAGYKPLPGKLTFNLPSDFLLESNRNFTLSLNLSYAAVMRKDSSLSIRANDLFVSSIALNDINGGQYRGYRIELPLSYLKPGLNTITFQPLLNPLHTGDCELVQTRNLAVTIFDDSRFILPEISHWVAMPRLNSLFEDGFPLAAYPDFRNTILVLPDKIQQSAVAAVNIIAMLSQKNKIPPLGLKISNEIPKDSDSELLVVGPLGSIPNEILEASPFFPKIEQPFWGRLPGTIREKSGWDDFIKSIYPISNPPEPVDLDVAELSMDMLAGKGKLLVNEFESPIARMRSVVMITADSPVDIEKGAAALWEPAVQFQCRAGLAIIDLQDTPPAAKSYRTHNAYYTGNIGSVSLISYFVNSHPWLFFVSLAVAFIILAGLLTYVLKRRFAKKNQKKTS